MKNLIAGAILIAALSVILSGCADCSKKGPLTATVHQRLEAFIDSIDVIDTHEHQRLPPAFDKDKTNFFSLLQREYIHADLVSAGMPGMRQELIENGATDSLWEESGRYLDFCRNTSYYGHFRDGLSLLYGFSDPYFTRENTVKLSQDISKNYSRFDQWYDEALGKTRIEMMFNDQYWSMFKTNTDHEKFLLVFRIDELVRGAARRGKLTDAEGDSVNSAYYFANKEDLKLNTLDDYLAYAEKWFERFTGAGAVCAKCALAYHRTLSFEPVSLGEAKLLYSLDPDRLTAEQKKKLEDFMMHWCVAKCGEYDLILQVHTGYLAGNMGQLENGRAIQLIDMFKAYPGTKFDLFHGGYPWRDDIGALAKSYPNVFIDLVWLPQISRSASVEALHEWLDAAPYNKFFWGGDCWSIEGAAGSLEYGRSVVAQVLAEKVEAGLMTEMFARTVAAGIFRNNAIENFGLEKKLRRELSRSKS